MEVSNLKIGKIMPIELPDGLRESVLVELKEIKEDLKILKKELSEIKENFRRLMENYYVIPSKPGEDVKWKA